MSSITRGPVTKVGEAICHPGPCRSGGSLQRPRLMCGVKVRAIPFRQLAFVIVARGVPVESAAPPRARLADPGSACEGGPKGGFIPPSRPLFSGRWQNAPSHGICVLDAPSAGGIQESSYGGSRRGRLGLTAVKGKVVQMLGRCILSSRGWLPLSGRLPTPCAGRGVQPRPARDKRG